MSNLNNTAYCSGDLGDTIYALAALKLRPEIHTLVLGDDTNRLRSKNIPPPFKGYTPETFGFIHPLIVAQGLNCIYENGNYECHNANIDMFRVLYRFKDAFWKNIAESIALTLGVDPRCHTAKWLSVPKPNPNSQGLAVFARSAKRYTHDPSFPWKDFVEAEKDNAVFVGTKHEHMYFCELFGNVPRVEVKDALQLAELIAGCKYMVCNTSLPQAIGEGLKVNMHVEMRPGYRHAYFERMGVSHNDHGKTCISLPPVRKNRDVHIAMRQERPSAEAERRILFAQSSWKKALYAHGVHQAHVLENQYPRSSRTVFNDNIDAMFFKDLLRIGLEETEEDEDLIIWTNDDTILRHDIYDVIKRYARKGVECFCSARLNFANPQTYEDLCNHEVPMQQDSGVDLFVFTRRWLKEHLKNIPDFVMVYSEFDYWMHVYIRTQNHWTLIEEIDVWRLQFPSYIPLGYVFHQRHESSWSQRRMLPAQKYNRYLCYKGLCDLGFKDRLPMARAVDTLGVVQ